MCPLCEKIAIALARFTSCWGGHLQVSARRLHARGRSPKAKVYLLECDSFSFQKALKDRSDWVQAIQTNLTLAFSGARETSSTAAAAAENAPAVQPSADAAAAPSTHPNPAGYRHVEGYLVKGTGLDKKRRCACVPAWCMLPCLPRTRSV